MNQYGFLAVPLKSTSDVDLVKPLTLYIDTVYKTSEDNKAEVAEAVQELNKLRSKACCQPLDKHQSALDIVTRYYDQLVAIENKIVISATQNPVVFKWKDAFDKGSLFFSKASLSISDGAFERAAVLFNCGALMSHIAASQPLLTDEEMKTAAKLFQQSAGVFARLRDTVLGMVQQDPTPDLMPDTLAALSAIMLGQAQESIYIKAYKDKMKPSALVKIAAQAGDFYQDALKAMNRDAVKGLWEKEWVHTVTGKMFGFQAISQLHQAGINAEQQEMSEQLSRLGEALKLSEMAAKYLPSGCLAEQLNSIQKMYTAAKKDNDFIICSQASYQYKFTMQCNAMKAVKQNCILASLNLPAALDDVTSMDTLPESIKQKSAKVKQAGGINELQRLFSELPGLYKRNEEILDEEIGKYRGILHTASNADKMVKEKFETNRAGIEMLSKNEVELRTSIPSQTQHAVAGSSEAVTKLRALMNQVQEIKVQREKLEKDFKAVRSDIADDLLRAMAESQILNEEQISKEKIQEIYGPLKEQVEQSIKQQDHIMAEVQTWNTRFTSEKSGSGTGAERERVLKTLATAADSFHELKGNLEEGTKFYNDLTPILVRLQQKVSDFSFARQTEKEDLMRSMQQNIVSGGSGSGGGGSK
ncbi:BRO1-like domain protein [Teladorsagia circumcincta]|uniref:BRO1-like domain protein n=1 Tax=Teladorsagia circumcincta TaxID=45464 RepID=A0A2G9V575_TELCI|nr:BRO1-like domain protein [Teladorsagia circumcincta]